MSRNNKDYFWLSYADLMTSLFFVMLVLFVLVVSIMQFELMKNIQFTSELQEQLELNDSIATQLQFQLSENEKVTEELRKSRNLLLAQADDVTKIRSINQALLALENGGYYVFNENCKRFELNQAILFGTNEAVIPNNQKKQLTKAGQELLHLIRSFKSLDNIKFLVVIEGRAARHEDERKNLKYAGNVKDLSYSRSLALFKLWNNHGFNFNAENSEILIAGSGFDGLCRYSGHEEGKNKRFIIQIIPYLIK